MKLVKLLEGIDYKLIQGDLNTEINDIKYDSRNIEKNDVFVALIGIDTDGHNYIENAINNGATAIIICKDIKIDTNITIIKIKDTRKELSYLSANLFNHPQDKLIKIAITGTKGKTSTSWMIKSILESANIKVGVIGTIGTYIDNKLYEHKNTTPESYLIQKYMKLMVDKNIKYLIMEASSQALKVGRINNIIFDYAIYTNLSTDHIGTREHPNFEDYKKSKSQLFKQSKIGIFNTDDKYYKDMIKNATCQIITYGKKGDFQINEYENTNKDNFLGISFNTTYKNKKETYKISSPGNFSIYNASAAILLCKLLNIDNKYIEKGLINFKVSGRCEIYNINNKYKVIIDFAHNKISIESIIKTIKEYKPNRIITIFGCGGGRSKEIRKELGTISGSLSDLSIITTDNPRNDNIDDINKDIEQGIKSVNGKYLIIKDREKAIEYAINNAKYNDIILLLGKGHEKYQEIKGIKYPFNEEEIIKKYTN